MTAFKPTAVIVDPVTNLISIGTNDGRQIDAGPSDRFLKANQITMVATSLTSGGDSEEQSEVGISSLMDTWLLVRNLETDGERNRGLYILKSRGMAHSNQVREFVLSGEGIQLVDVYTGQGTLLTGSARLAQLARERDDETLHQQEFEAKRAATVAQISALQMQVQAAQEELKRLTLASASRGRLIAAARSEIARSRKATRMVPPFGETPMSNKTRHIMYYSPARSTRRTGNCAST